MSGKPTSPEIARIVQLRDHYAAKVRECEVALAVLRDADRLTREAEKQIARVRSRAAADGPPPRGYSQHKTAIWNRAQRAKAKAASRPMDRLRHAYASAAPKTLITIDDAAAVIPDVHRRHVALALACLARRGELKKTRDGGFVVRAIRETATEQAGATNGAGA